MKTATVTKFKETETGTIPEGWGVLNVGKIGKVITGKTPPTSDQEFYGNEYPFVKIPDMTESVYITKTETKISQKGAEYLGKAKLPKNSIMVSCIATVGNVGITSEESFTNQQINSLIPDPSIADFKYLYYFFKANKSYLESLGGGGSVYTNISKSKFENMEVFVPPVVEQKEIAEILSSLDDKIELNRKINADLERLAGSLFKKWFVDIGDELPDGWRMGAFGEAITNFDSKRIPLSSREREKRQGSYPYYGATSIMDYVDDFIFDGTYVLLGEDGSVAKEDGKPFVQYVYGKMWVNNHAHVLQGKNGFSTEYIKVFLDQVDIMPFVTGAVQPKLNQANMNSVPIVIPDQKTLGKFNEILTAFFGMILENESQTKNLEQVRDSLLSRLMSGKIRV